MLVVVLSLCVPVAVGVTLADGHPGAIWIVALACGIPFRMAFRVLGPRRRPRASVVAHMELAPEREPELAALVRGAAETLGLRAPGTVCLSFGTQVTTLRERSRPLLVVGIPWLVGASAEALAVAVAHALVDDRTAPDAKRLVLARERLARARELVGSSSFGFLWREFADRGERLASRATLARQLVARRACDQAFGAEALGAYLRASHRQTEFGAFWREDVGPVIAAGFAPPVLDGWERLIGEPWFREHVDGDVVDAAMPVTLHSARRQLELELLTATYPDTAPALVGIDWPAVGAAVALPELRRIVAPWRERLASATPATLQEVVGSPPEDIAASEWPTVVEAALAVMLAEAGWHVDTPLGQPLEVRRDGLTLRPFGLCRSLLDGTADLSAWAELMDIAEIADVPLVPPTPVKPDTPTPDVDWSASAMPAGTTTRIGIRRPPHARRRGLTIVAIGAVLGLAVTASLGFSAAREPSGRLAMAGLGLSLLIGLTVWVISRTRALMSIGAVIVTAESIRIEDGGLLKQAFEIPRTAVRTIAVDDRSSNEERFPLGVPPHHLPGDPIDAGQIRWLWRRDEELVVPLLGIGTEVPNVALLFEDPLPAPRTRHVGSRSHGPLPGEALTGLLLCVEDPDAARAALAPWDVTGTISGEDALHVVSGFLGERYDVSGGA